MLSNKSKSTKQESQTNSTIGITPGNQQRTRGSKFLFQELYRKQEEERLKVINKENPELGFENASVQANKYLNHGHDAEGSPKCASAPSNIYGKSPKGLAKIKVRSGQVKIRPPISAADISFDGKKIASTCEKENTKRKRISKDQEKDFKGKNGKTINTAKIVKESKDEKGKNKSKKFKSHTQVLQNSNSSNSSLEIIDNIINKTNDADMPVEDFLSSIGTSTQEIFQNKDYKGNDSPKNSPSKDVENLNNLQNLINDETNIFKIFTPSSSPETVEICSDSDNESNDENREGRKVAIEETVIQPFIFAEDSFQSRNKDNTSDSFDCVHKEVMTQVTAGNESPIIGIKKTKRKKSGISNKPTNIFLIDKLQEKCESTDSVGEQDQKKEVKSFDHTGRLVKTSKQNLIENETTRNISRNMGEAQINQENDNVSLNEERIKTFIDRKKKNEVKMTPECGTRRSFPEISPCSDAETSPFLSQPNQLMQTPRSKSIFTKLSLSQRKKFSNSQKLPNSEIDSTPQKILKSNLKSHFSKITSDSNKCALTEFEDMSSSFIMSSDSNTSDSFSSVVETSSLSFADRTPDNPQTVNFEKFNPHGTQGSTISHNIFDPEFKSTQHFSIIQEINSNKQVENKSGNESEIQTEGISPELKKKQEPEVITIKSSSSESSSNNSMATNLKQVPTEKANSSEGSSLSYASSDSTEMLKPVGRSCLSGVTMIMEQFFGGSMEECLKVLQKNSFNILTTIQELQELYPDATEIMGEDTVYDTFNHG